MTWPPSRCCCGCSSPAQGSRPPSQQTISACRNGLGIGSTPTWSTGASWAASGAYRHSCERRQLMAEPKKRKYVVSGPVAYADHQPGEEFEAALPDEEEERA